ncbi:MAG: hypothetical protein LBG83_01510 [Oscillospiraceae bacterium]|nr:hypothetical protein [Oscillospiraceae bacterium]
MKKSWKESPFLRLGVLVLFVAALCTVPLGMGKYYATGEGSATAHIAKWDVIYPPYQIGCWNNGTAIAGAVGTSGYQSFALENKSEVLVDFYCWVGYVVSTASDAIPSESSSRSPYFSMSLEDDRSVTQFYDQSNIAYYNARTVNGTIGGVATNCVAVTVANGFSAAEVAANPNTWRIRVPMGGVAIVRLTFQMGTGSVDGTTFANNLGHRCKIFFQAVQVD